MPVSSVPLPADDGLRRIADLPLDEVAVHLLNSLFDKRKHVRLRDDLTELATHCRRTNWRNFTSSSNR